MLELDLPCDGWIRRVDTPDGTVLGLEDGSERQNTNREVRTTGARRVEALGSRSNEVREGDFRDVVLAKDLSE